MNSNFKSFLCRHTQDRRGEVRPTTLLGLAVALLLIACVTLAIWNSRIQSRIELVERERDEARATLAPLQETLKSREEALSKSEIASQSKTQTAEDLRLAEKASTVMSAAQSQIDQLTTRATLLQQKNDQSEENDWIIAHFLPRLEWRFLELLAIVKQSVQVSPLIDRSSAAIQLRA